MSQLDDNSQQDVENYMENVVLVHPAMRRSRQAADVEEMIRRHLTDGAQLNLWPMVGEYVNVTPERARALQPDEEVFLTSPRNYNLCIECGDEVDLGGGYGVYCSACR